MWHLQLYAAGKPSMQDVDRLATAPSIQRILHRGTRQACVVLRVGFDVPSRAHVTTAKKVRVLHTLLNAPLSGSQS